MVIVHLLMNDILVYYFKQSIVRYISQTPPPTYTHMRGTQLNVYQTISTPLPLKTSGQRYFSYLIINYLNATSKCKNLQT